MASAGTASEYGWDATLHFEADQSLDALLNNGTMFLIHFFPDVFSSSLVLMDPRFSVPARTDRVPGALSAVYDSICCLEGHGRILGASSSRVQQQG